MKNKELNKVNNDTKKELARERKISLLQIILILVLILCGVLLAVFSDDSAYIAVLIRKIFGKY